MKKYIMLAQIISTMGGGQLYARNKINYMKSLGYDPYVISYMGGEVIIDDLKKHEKNVIHELSIFPFIFTKKNIEKIINKIEKMVDGIDENTIIESNTYPGVFWGEILAERFHCRHFIYIIIEKMPKLNQDIIDFFSFKRERNELNGIKNETYKMIFGHLPIEDNYNYRLPLVCTNVVEDCVNKEFNVIEYQQFNIATIGRLGKLYVPTLIDEIIKFANNHKDINISYVMIGDSQKKSDFLKIKGKFSKVDNIKLFLMGNVYPIPLNFLKKIDVFVSSAGSVRVSANIGKPTIAIDGRDYHSIGVFNYDTKNSLFRNDEPKVPISTELDYLYKDDLYKKIKIKKCDSIENKIDEILSTHLEQYKKSNNKRKYYDFSIYKLNAKQKVGKIVLNTFGIKVYKVIQKKIAK